MIKFTAKTPSGSTFIGLGLEAENIKRLQLGQPIIVNGIDLGLPIDIAIFFGETKEKMMDMLLGAGVRIPPEAIQTDIKNPRQP